MCIRDRYGDYNIKYEENYLTINNSALERRYQTIKSLPPLERTKPEELLYNAFNSGEISSVLKTEQFGDLLIFYRHPVGIIDLLNRELLSIQGDDGVISKREEIRINKSGESYYISVKQDNGWYPIIADLR